MPIGALSLEKKDMFSAMVRVPAYHYLDQNSSPICWINVKLDVFFSYNDAEENP